MGSGVKNWLKTPEKYRNEGKKMLLRDVKALYTNSERSRLLLQHLHKLGLRAGGANLLL